MKISIGADVAARGARVGKVRRVILDPETFDIQRIIIERLAGAGEALIPADKIYEATEELVTIDLSADEIYALPAFEDEGYIPLAQLERDPSALPFSPIEPALIPFSFVPSATAPENVSPPLSPEPATDPRSRAVRAGMEVYAGNHKVGEIREVIFDGSDKRLVSFVIERGWFARCRDPGRFRQRDRGRPDRAQPQQTADRRARSRTARRPARRFRPRQCLS
jgi:sporulation protein YlmC with PRC-barrel domain